MDLFASVLEAGDSVQVGLEPGRHAWVQVADGSVTVNGEELVRGDGLAVSEEGSLVLEGRDGGGELLLFNLA